MPVIPVPAAQAGRGDPKDLAGLLRQLDCGPHVQVQDRTDRVTFLVRDLVVATLNCRTRVLSVNAAPDMVRLLLDGYSQLVRTKDSLNLCVIDAESCAAAEVLLRWRIDLEQFAHQLRAASP